METVLQNMIVVLVLFIVVLLLSPVTRAHIRSNGYCLLHPSAARVYVETTKERGAWMSSTTCVAVVDSDNSLVKVFYGKPDMLYLLNLGKEKHGD